MTVEHESVWKNLGDLGDNVFKNIKKRFIRQIQIYIQYQLICTFKMISGDYPSLISICVRALHKMVPRDSN